VVCRDKDGMAGNPHMVSNLKTAMSVENAKWVYRTIISDLNISTIGQDHGKFPNIAAFTDGDMSFCARPTLEGNMVLNPCSAADGNLGGSPNQMGASYQNP